MHRVIGISFMAFLFACGGQEQTDDAGLTDSGADSAKAKDGSAADAADAAVDAPFDVIDDWSNYDASWYDGGVLEPCPPIDTPCNEPEILRYACCHVVVHCDQGLWTEIPGDDRDGKTEIDESPPDCDGPSSPVHIKSDLRR